MYEKHALNMLEACLRGNNSVIVSAVVTVFCMVYEQRNFDFKLHRK